MVIKLKSANREFNVRALIASMYVRRGDNYSELGEYTSAVKDYTIGIEMWTIELKTRWKNSYTFDYYYKRSEAYERLGKHEQAKKDFRDGVKLAFDKKEAESHFKSGQELEDTEKFIADSYFKRFGKKLEGAEDQEGKELKIRYFKIAAILGHQKAQVWLKKKRIEW